MPCKEIAKGILNFSQVTCGIPQNICRVWRKVMLAKPNKSDDPHVNETYCKQSTTSTSLHNK